MPTKTWCSVQARDGLPRTLDKQNKFIAHMKIYVLQSLECIVCKTKSQQIQ